MTLMNIKKRPIENDEALFYIFRKSVQASNAPMISCTEEHP